MGRLQEQIRKERARLRMVQARNVETLRRQPWQELSGAFGDLGTFIPIFVALAINTQWWVGEELISVSSTLVFSGLANILTGMYFGIPLPVQPMKAIAAVAIARGRGSRYKNASFGAAELQSAGLFVSACVGLLSFTGLMHRFTRIVPVPVVKGIQVGTGLVLAMKGVEELPLTQDWAFSIPDTLPLLIALGFVLVLASFRRFPLALIITAGVAFFGALGYTIEHLTGRWSTIHSFTLWEPRLSVPDGYQFLGGALGAGLGQLPLTTLNSVVAVVYLAEDLFPQLTDTGAAPGATSVGISVFAINMVSCWFRAMPVCHGSGGLAAQYRFGARSGASVIILGLIKLVFGLFASEWVLAFCVAFPKFLFAVLLLLAGQELVKMGESVNGEAARDLWYEDEEEEEAGLTVAAREAEARAGDEAEESRFGIEQEGDGSQQQRLLPSRRRHLKFKPPSEEERARRWTVMAMTVIGLLGAKNDGAGFILGMLTHGVHNAHDWWVARQRGRTEGTIQLPQEDEPAIVGSVEREDDDF